MPVLPLPPVTNGGEVTTVTASKGIDAGSPTILTYRTIFDVPRASKTRKIPRSPMTEQPERPSDTYPRDRYVKSRMKVPAKGLLQKRETGWQPTALANTAISGSKCF